MTNRFQIRIEPCLLLLVCCLFVGCSSASDGARAYPKAVAEADEGSAIQALRTIATAQTQAKGMRGAYADFDSLVQAGLLDQRFAGSSPTLRGYRFVMNASENGFTVNADPPAQTGPAAGSRHFYMDATENGIRVNTSQPATKQDPLL